MMNRISRGRQQLDVVHVTDETARLLEQLLSAGGEFSLGQLVDEAPAVREADQHHPFGGIGEVGEVGIVARMRDVEVDGEVDEHAAVGERVACHLVAELPADIATATVASEQVRGGKLGRTRGSVDLEQHALVANLEGDEPVPGEELTHTAAFQLGREDGLELVLRDVRDEGKAGVARERVEADGVPGAVRGALDLTDLVIAQC